MPRSLNATASFLVLAAALTPFSVVHAQTNDTASELAEIVVTARKVEENLQQVPVAVTAYTGEQMRARSIQQPQDLQNSTPSLTVSGSAVRARNSATYSIRGQGNAGATSGAPPGVPIYFADAPIGQPGAPTFFDMANIQVLKGPQGTLFGRTSTGGAVLMNPEKANFNGFDGYVTGRLGNLNYRYLEGAVNVPIIEDKLAVRVSGNLAKRRGFTKSLDNGKWYDDLDRQALRFSVRFKPFSFIDNHAMLQWERYDENGSSYTLGAARTDIAALNTPLAGFATVCGTTATNSGIGLTAPERAAFVAGCQAQRVQLQADIRAGLTAERARLTSGAQGGIRAWRTNNQGPEPFMSQSQKLFVNDLRLSAPDLGILTDLTVRDVYSKMFDSKYNLVANLDGSQFRLLDQVFNGRNIPGVCSTSGPTIGQCSYGTIAVVDAPYSSYDIPYYSNEVNITGKIADVLRFTLGNYYFQIAVNQSDFLYTAYNTTFGSTLNPNLNLGPNSFGVMWTKQLEQGNFAQGDLDLSRWIHGLSISGGYRRTLSKSEVVNRRAFESNALGGTLSGPVVNEVNTHTLSFNERLTDRITFYGRTSTGYKPGGVNIPCVAGGQIALAGISCPLRYAPENVKDYELGIKSDWRTGGVQGRTNASIYKMNWQGVQRQVRLLGNSYINNAALGKIKGLELEQVLAFGDVVLTGNYSYTKARYARWWDTAAGFPCTDNINNSKNDCANFADSPFQNTPKNQLSLSARYTLPLDESIGKVSATINYYTQSSVFYSDNPKVNPNGYSPGYSVSNLRIDWNDMFGRPMDGAFFVRNLLDKEYTIYRGDSAASVGVAYFQWAEPRTWGVELRYRFGQSAR